MCEGEHISHVCVCVCACEGVGVCYTPGYLLCGLIEKLSINITHCSLQDVHKHIQIAICILLYLHVHSYIYIYNIQVNEYI